MLKIRLNEPLLVTLDPAAKSTSITFSPEIVLHRRDRSIGITRDEPYRAEPGDHPILRIILWKIFRDNEYVHCVTVYHHMIYVCVDNFEPALLHPWLARRLYRKAPGVSVVNGETGKPLARESRCPLRRRLQRKAGQRATPWA